MELEDDIQLTVDRLEFGDRLLRTERLPGGVSAEVVRLDVLQPSGAERAIVFRQHRALEPAHRNSTIVAKEFAVLTSLHQRGFSVPEPLALVDDPALHAPVLITGLVSGTTSVDDAALGDSVDEMARFLVDLHGLDPLELGAAGLEPIEDPTTGVLRLLAERGAGPGVATALGAGPQRLNPEAVLHGDYWPGNVMWHGGRLAAVIDWEDACIGDLLADLATARVELLCHYGDHAMKRFTNTYLELATSAGSAIRLDDLPIWELTVSAAALASMHTWGLDPDNETRRREATTSFFDRAAAQIAPGHSGTSEPDRLVVPRD